MILCDFWTVWKGGPSGIIHLPGQAQEALEQILWYAI